MNFHQIIKDLKANKLLALLPKEVIYIADESDIEHVYQGFTTAVRRANIYPVQVGDVLLAWDGNIEDERKYAETIVKLGTSTEFKVRLNEVDYDISLIYNKFYISAFSDQTFTASELIALHYIANSFYALELKDYSLSEINRVLEEMEDIYHTTEYENLKYDIERKAGKFIESLTFPHLHPNSLEDIELLARKLDTFYERVEKLNSNIAKNYLAFVERYPQCRDCLSGYTVINRSSGLAIVECMIDDFEDNRPIRYADNITISFKTELGEWKRYKRDLCVKYFSFTREVAEQLLAKKLEAETKVISQ